MLQLWKKMRQSIIEVWDQIVSSDNQLLGFFWVSCVAGVIVMGILVQSSPSGFLGIADTRESVINFEFPVTIQRIHVISGQLVQRGDLIAELEQPDLEMKIHLAQSQLDRLQAEQNLKREMNHLGAGLTAKYNKTTVVSADQDISTDPMETQIRSLKHEIAVLETRKKNLYVFAEISGVIGSVNFKKGETASPFSPLMTISPLAPTYVQGYVYESLQYQVKVGQKMQVHSLTDPGKLVDGRVVSVGSRIVELPIRMLRMQTQKLWGREVAIEIPSSNHFLLGEKVEVSPKHFWFGISSAQAENTVTDSSKKLASAVQDMTLPEALLQVSAFEPSGAIYLADLHKYVVVSDDTNEADAAFVFLLNQDGSVDPAPIKVEGTGTVQDIESISQDKSGFIYLLGSQGLSSKSKIKKDRNLIVKVKRTGLKFTALDTLELRPLLIEAIKKSGNKDLLPLLKDIQAEVEIEGHLIQQDHLWIALKKPLDENGRSLILDLGAVAQIFSSRSIGPKDLKLIARIEFPAQGQRITRIVDMIQVENDLLLGTFSKDPGTTGRLWKMNLGTQKLALLAEFPSHSPEGLAYDAPNQELMVLFDEGTAAAKYQKLTYPMKK